MTRRTLKDLTLAEKIVWLFQQRVTEAHRDAITLTLKISDDQFGRRSPRRVTSGFARSVTRSASASIR